MLWQGLPTSLLGQKISPELLSFRASYMGSDEARRALEAEIEKRGQASQKELGEFGFSDLARIGDEQTLKSINAQQRQMRLVHLNRFKIEVEDADTLLLKRKGIRGWFSEPVSVRLAGIDAPEVAAHPNDPMRAFRIWQEQPGGQAAKARLQELIGTGEGLQVAVSTGRKTYGRYLGAVVGPGGENLAVQLAREGMVSALPFGRPEEDIVPRSTTLAAERTAQKRRRGIWQYARYQAIAETTKVLGNDITYTTLADVTRMSGNLTMGAYGSFLHELGTDTNLTDVEREQARRFGKALRKSYGPRRLRERTSATLPAIVSLVMTPPITRFKVWASGVLLRSYATY